MDNKDWNVKERELEKDFYFKSQAEAKKFISQLKKLAKAEGHNPEVVSPDKNTVRVRIHVAGPEMYEEKDIRLANLINRLVN